MFPEHVFAVEGVSATSDVPDQPKGDSETFMGALNRVNNAKARYPDSDFWIGLEGGVDELMEEMATFAWIVIESKHGLIGKARTSTLFLPDAVADLVRQGYELGDADDVVFKKQNSKQSNGAIGLLTHDVLNRRTSYQDTVILALIPHKNPKYFTK